VRGADAVRFAVATTCLTVPTLPARLARSDATDTVVCLTRILALRYLCQATVNSLSLNRASSSSARLILAAGASVEAVHAASMAPIATLFPAHAPLATGSGVLATGLSAVDLVDLRRVGTGNL
jgi:hypothetical protein